MANWNKNTPWPKLEKLNNGEQFSTRGVTSQVFNAIVNALLYLDRIFMNKEDNT